MPSSIEAFDCMDLHDKLPFSDIECLGVGNSQTRASFGEGEVRSKLGLDT